MFEMFDHGILVVAWLLSPIGIIDSLLSWDISGLLFSLLFFFAFYGNILSILGYIIARIFKREKLKTVSKYGLCFGLVSLIIIFRYIMR